jgi:hypothetical protein
VVEETLDGDVRAARERARLFMIPGMGTAPAGPVPTRGTSSRR